MELTFSDLRSKEVINTKDGRRLGRVCDILLCYPENRWLGVVVPGDNGFFRKKNDLFIDLKNIVTIGEDVILVNVGLPSQQKYNEKCHHGCHQTPPPHPNYTQPRQGYYESGHHARNYEEME